MEFPDSVVLELLKQYGELKTENFRPLYFQEEGFSHIERGIRVAEFTRINRDLPRRIVTHIQDSRLRAIGVTLQSTL